MSAHDEYAATAGFHLENPEAAEVLVLLHGLGADHRQPLDLIDGWDAEGLAVLAPDARAHGDTAVIGERPDFRFESLLRDLQALMARLGQTGKPIHLVGISMGSAVALRAALGRDLDVRSLTLVRPAFTDVPLPPNLRVMARIGDLLRTGDDPADARARFVRSRAYREVADTSPLGGASLLSQFDAPLAVERSVRLRSVPRNAAYSGVRELGSLSVPTLVIGTERDPVHPLPLAYGWSVAIPGSRFATIPPRDEDPAASAARQRALVIDHIAASKAASWR